MRLEDNPDKGRKVWLSQSDVHQLVNSIDDTKRRIAVRLMVDSGLRTKEVLQAAHKDVKPLDGDSDGYKLRVWEGKGEDGGKYRETWIPNDLVSSVNTYVDMADKQPDEPLVDVTRQTIQRWIRGLREDLQADTGDEGWMHLTAHDLRRTWGTEAIEANMAPTVVMQCGGWEDFKTFQQHYMDQHSDSVIAREASKVMI